MAARVLHKENFLSDCYERSRQLEHSRNATAALQLRLQILGHNWPSRPVTDVKNENVGPRMPVENEIGILPQWKAISAFGIYRNADPRKLFEIVNRSFYSREHVAQTCGGSLFEVMFNADEITQSPGGIDNHRRPLRRQKALI